MQVGRGWCGVVSGGSDPYHPTFDRDTTPISLHRQRAHHRLMPASRRRFLPLLFAVALVLPAAVPAAAGSDPAVSSAEAAALTYANKERTARGLVPLRLDSRLQEIAHARAETMASEDELSHDQADGSNVFDLLSAADIKRYKAGEIIAWNTWDSYGTSAKGAIAQWIKSSGHRAILLSGDYNYVAFGFAVSPDSGRRYWAGVFIKGPDRSGAWSKLYTPVKTAYSSSRTKVTFRWTGADTKLQVLTSGLRSFEIQRRVSAGEWVSYGSTKATSLTTSWARGYTYEFRVRAVDWAGNWGGWKTVVVKL